MVKIIKGIYGYKDENGTIEPKTPKDAPFCLTKEQEARLVSKGVAEYVTDKPAQQEMEGEHKGQLEEMRYNELKELAKKMGISAAGTKADLAKRIAVAVCEENEKNGWTGEGVEDEEENEEPPVINPEEPQ